MISTEPWYLLAVFSIALVYRDHGVSADCGSPPIYSDKTHTNYDNTYTTGDTATYSCAAGHDVQSGSNDRTSTCQANGIWSSITFTCTPGSCPSLSAPAHSTQSSYDYRVGRQVEFTCDTGYNLQGNAITTCMADRTWSQAVPTCIIVTCPSLANPSNGQISSTATTYGTTVTYTCTSGYIYSEASATRQCQTNGTWSGVDGQCNEIDCGEPTIYLGTFEVNGGTTYAYFAQFSCNAGTLRVPAADVLSQCKAQQKWDPPPPRCYKACSPHVVENAEPTAAGSNSQHGTVVTVSCSTGYQLFDGQSNLNCTNGTWIPQTMACVLTPTEASITTWSTTQELPPPQSTDNPATNGTANLHNQRKLALVALGASLCVIAAVVPIGCGVKRYHSQLNKGASDVETLQVQSSRRDAKNVRDEDMIPEKKILLGETGTVHNMPETSNDIKTSKL